jgi:hypothetical protein
MVLILSRPSNWTASVAPVINAPAGSGKTRVMTEAARVWAAAGRPVIGITPSHSARNTLAAGVTESYNAAQFLGHLPGHRGARGPLDIVEGTLPLVDESLMIPTPDLADLVSLAEYAAPRWSWPATTPAKHADRHMSKITCTTTRDATR